MGTAKKLILASLVSTMMVLMFAVGFLPSLGVVDVGAAEEGRRLDMVRFLKMFLSEDKQLDGVEITSPADGTQLVFIDNSMEFPLDAEAQTSPAGQGAQLSFGVDGEIVPEESAWRGSLAGAANDNGTATIDLAPLQMGGTLEGNHDLFALAEVAKQAQMYVAYEVFDQISFSVDLLDAAVVDENGDGILDDPFGQLSPGQRLRNVIIRDGQVKIIIHQDLDVPAKGVEEPLGVSLQEEDANGKPIGIDTPSLQQLIDAGALVDNGADTQGVLVAIISTSLDSLLNTDDTPNEADNIGEFPTASDGASLIEGIGFGASYVELSIVTTEDGGSTRDEISQLPDGLDVGLKYGELENVSVDSTSGAGLWSHSTDAGPMTEITVSPSAGWEKRVGSILDTVNASLEVYLSYLSIQAPLESQFRVDGVDPPAAKVTNIPEDAEIVEVDGFFPLAEDEMGNRMNISSAAEAAEAYRVYFGSPADLNNEATFVDIPAKQSDIVTPSTMTVQVPTLDINENQTVDVWVFDKQATSDFASSPMAFTFAVQPTVDGIEPDAGPLTNNPPVMITGNNLTAAESVIFRDDVNNVQAPASINLAQSTNTTLVVQPPDAPSGEPGPVDVVVTTAGGEAANTPTFLYQAAPVVDGVSPTTLPAQGGDRTVTITGENLINVSLVSLAGLQVDPATIIEGAKGAAGNSITVTAPEGPDDGVSGPVIVTTAGGTFNTDPDIIFTFEPLQVGPPDLRVDDVSPKNAWVFGGMVVKIEGESFTATGDGMPEVSFNGMAAEVLEASDTELYVQVPRNDGVTGQMADVDVEVSTGNAEGESDTFEGFRYYRFIENNGVTTTAGTLSGGVGSVPVVLDADSPATTATLTVPVTFNTKSLKGSTDRATLVRASRAPSDFGLAPSDNGDNVTNAWVFDFHLYSLDYNTGNVDFTTGGVPTTLEITDQAEFTKDNQATLTSPVGSANLAEANLTNIALYGEVTALEHIYPTGGVNFTPGSEEVYQSQLMDGEFSSDGTTITDLTEARLRNLGAIAVRQNVVPDISDFNIQLVEDTQTKGTTTPSGPVDEVTRLRAIAEEGGLGFLENPLFGDDLTTEAGTDAGIAGTVIEGGDGTGEFEAVIGTPTDADGATVGVKDVGLIISADPDPETPAFVFVDGFEFTPAAPGTGFLRALLVLLGLVGADSGGGGGGGPCFIATAAYGTPMADDINTLRAVRDSYLLDNAAGTAFVDTYYRVAPAIADVIAQSPMLAAMVRLMLLPVVFAGNILLAAPQAALAALMLVSGALLVRSRTRRSKKA